MATIRFSSLITFNTITWAGPGGLMTTVANAAPSVIAGSTTANVSSLVIYKGVPPENFSVFSDAGTRADDILITFPIGATSWINLGVVNMSSRFLIGRCLTPTAASASGTATWFLLRRNGTDSLTDKGALMGTVGDVGSGSDLEVGNTSIFSGAPYQSSGFIVNYPQNQDV